MVRKGIIPCQWHLAQLKIPAFVSSSDQDDGLGDVSVLLPLKVEPCA